MDVSPEYQRIAEQHLHHPAHQTADASQIGKLSAMRIAHQKSISNKTSLFNFDVS
jgi:hypothetical protein